MSTDDCIYADGMVDACAFAAAAVSLSVSTTDARTGTPAFYWPDDGPDPALGRLAALAVFRGDRIVHPAIRDAVLAVGRAWGWPRKEAT